MATEQKQQSKNTLKSVLTSETFGVILMLFTTLCLVCLISGDKIFSAPGLYVAQFLCGLFGYASIPLSVYVFALGLFMLIGKKPKISKKRKTLIFLLCLFAVFTAHIATMHSFIQANPQCAYGDYLVHSYEMGSSGLLSCSGGGITSSLICYFITLLLTNVGSYVVLGVLMCVLAYLLFTDKAKGSKSGTKSMKSTYVTAGGTDKLEEKEYPIEGVDFKDYPTKAQPKQGLFVVNADDFSMKSKKEMKQEESTFVSENMNGLNVVTKIIANSEKENKTPDILQTNVVNNSTYSDGYSEEMMQKLNYIRTPSEINVKPDNYYGYQRSESAPERTEQIRNINVSEPISRTPDIPFVEHDETEETDTAESRAETFSRRYAEIEETPAETTTPTNLDGLRESDETEQRAREDAFSIFGDGARNDAHVQDDVQLSDMKEQDNSFVEENEVTEQNQETARTERGLFDSISKEVDEESSEETHSDRRSIFDEEDDITPSQVTGFAARERGMSSFGLRNDSSKQEDGESERSIERNIERPIERSEGRTIERPTERPIERPIANSRPIAQPEPIKEPVPEEKPKRVVPVNRKYNKPPLDLLERRLKPANLPEEDHAGRMEIIKNTLAEFKIDVTPSDYVQGPTITRYAFTVAAGVPLRKILSADENIRMRLASKEGIRIEAPIPGRDKVGIEVENEYKIPVGIREVMEDMEKMPSAPNQLMFAVGKDIVGNTFYDNLAKGPHYIIAGQTGSGKSVCLNALLVSLIMRYSPEDFRLILIDPKLVEFRPFEHLPHLCIDEIISDPPKVIAALQWAYEETERRNLIFKNCEEMIVKIEEYNKSRKPGEAKMPRIVIVIDELADLMTVCKKDLETKISAISAKSRSAGIHLVLATQRPSVDVITGTIKNNLPSRIAFKVGNAADSGTIINGQGAEKLLGNGDMLYKNATDAFPKRYQGAFITSEEVNAVVKYIKNNNEAYFDDDMKEYLDKAVKPKQEEHSSFVGNEDGFSEADEDLVKKATLHAIKSGGASISSLQRRFGLGWARAGKIIDKMCDLGYISGNDGSKARKVLISMQEYEAKYGPISEG